MLDLAFDQFWSLLFIFFGLVYVYNWCFSGYLMPFWPQVRALFWNIAFHVLLMIYLLFNIIKLNLSIVFGVIGAETTNDDRHWWSAPVIGTFRIGAHCKSPLRLFLNKLMTWVFLNHVPGWCLTHQNYSWTRMIDGAFF